MTDRTGQGRRGGFGVYEFVRLLYHRVRSRVWINSAMLNVVAETVRISQFSNTPTPTLRDSTLGPKVSVLWGRWIRHALTRMQSP